MKKFHSEIVNKSTFHGALMDGDNVVYVLYEYKGHVYRCQSHRLTSADDSDREQVEASKAWRASF